ncbi:NfeD family protein [Haladaptatus sp. F3-133]|uniref:NfeD family protein n=1 Tax=Halorutilus salinus TaxID=2487751 RepID=A0A9Q4C374_9EURY|nr:NfeD family protein [Halorutilus salinus]MCX2819030.1 NfeD family protein [Halorutilus salinus]
MVEGLFETFLSGTELSLIFAFVGLFLLMGEALVPGGTLMVLGVGVMVAGVTGQVFGFDGLLPLTVLTGVYGTIAFAGFKRFDFYGDRGEQTSGAESLRGETGVVEQTVTSQEGEVKLDSGGFDPFFMARSATGDEIPEGERVRVVDPGGGNVVQVESVSDDEGGDEKSPADR